MRQAKGNGLKFTVFSLATQHSSKNADDEWSSKTEWHRVVGNSRAGSFWPAQSWSALPPTGSRFVEQPIHTTSTSRAMACPHGPLTRIPLVQYSPASLRCSDRVEVRPLCQERVASAAGVGDVSISRNSLRFAVRVAGHLDTCRQDGVHRSGRCGWAGTQFDCRARPGRSPQCPRKGQTPWSPASHRESRQNRPSSSTGAFLGEDCSGAGDW